MMWAATSINAKAKKISWHHHTTTNYHQYDYQHHHHARGMLRQLFSLYAAMLPETAQLETNNLYATKNEASKQASNHTEWDSQMSQPTLPKPCF